MYCGCSLDFLGCVESWVKMDIKILGDDCYFLESKEEKITVNLCEDRSLWRVKRIDNTKLNPLSESKFFDNLHSVEMSFERLEGIALLHLLQSNKLAN